MNTMIPLSVCVGVRPSARPSYCVVLRHGVVLCRVILCCVVLRYGAILCVCVFVSAVYVCLCLCPCV